MKQVTIRVSDRVWEYIKARADFEDRSLNNMMGRLLTEKIDEEISVEVDKAYEYERDGSKIVLKGVKNG